jgi:prevent-host-death family protein
MTRIGAYAAKTRLLELLERVKKGERIVITKHGRPVAELAPVDAADVAPVRQSLAAIRRVRKSLARRGVTTSNILRRGESLRDLASEGHRR